MKNNIMIKGFFAFVLVFNLIIPLNVFALEDSETYVSYKSLSEDEKSTIFEEGYKEIIVYNNNGARSSGTLSVTKCIEMKKKKYGWLGYCKDYFHETYTSVSLGGNSYTFSVSLGGVGVSFPVDGISNKSGNIGLTPSDLKKVTSGTHYSCIRFKAYATWAKYSCKIYNNSSGNLIKTTTYTHTYTYKDSKNKGLDYYLVARTPKQLNEIKNSKYVGTSSEKKNMPSWRKVSSSSSILP